MWHSTYMELKCNGANICEFSVCVDYTTNPFWEKTQMEKEMPIWEQKGI